MAPATHKSLDFLVIGAARSGTTSLHEYLRRQPGVRVPANKEAPFFVTRDEYGRGWEEFSLRLFGSRPEKKNRTLGKVTPQYMAGSLYWVQASPPPDDPLDLIGTADPEVAATIVPRRIAAHNPDIKLIAILRDPTERALSHYRHAYAQGWEARPPDVAFKDALQPAALDRARLTPGEYLSSYVAFGEYARILGGYLSVFDRNQICVLSYLDLKDEPAATLRRVLRHIGQDDRMVPFVAGERFNASNRSPRCPALDMRMWDRRTSQWRYGWRLWSKAGPRTRNAVDHLFAYAFRLDERYNRVPAPAEGSSGEATALLKAHYAPWSERLKSIVGQVRGVT